MSEQEFDSSEFAFLYFAVSVLIMVLLPLTYNILKHPIRTFLLRSHKRDARYHRISSHPSAHKKIQLDQQERKYQWLTSSYMFRVLVWVLLICVFINTWNQLPDAALMRGFDPYEVLNVSRDANSSEVKKAYRKLALLYHPDKTQQQDDKLFIMVTKAYECLEDPKKLLNCRKYGNPDGYKGFQIGIALPSFIFDPQHQAMYLILILGGFVVTVVAVMYSVFNNMGRYDHNHIRHTNSRVFKEALQKKQLCTVGGCLEMVCEMEELEAFKGTLNVLEAYMKHTSLDSISENVLHQILKVAPNALQSAGEYNMKCIDKIRKSTEPVKLPFNLKELSSYTLNCFKAQACIVQANPINAEPSVQLSMPLAARDFYEAVRKRNDLKNISGETLAELALFPDVDFRVHTEKFDPEVDVSDLHTSDLFLIGFRVEHHNPSLFVHSLHYPFIKEHHWHVVLLHRDEIIQYQKLTDAIPPLESPIVTGQFKVVPYFYTMDAQQTKFVFQVLIFSDSYLDLHYKTDVVIVAKRASERQAEEQRFDTDEEDSQEEEEKVQKPKHKSKQE